MSRTASRCTYLIGWCGGDARCSMTNHGRGGGGRRAGLVEPGCQAQYSATTEIAVGACTTGAKQFLSLAIELYRTYNRCANRLIHTQAPRPRRTIDGSRTAVPLSAERRKPCCLLCRSSPDRGREHAAWLGFRDEDVSHAPAAVGIYRSVGCAPSRDTKVQQTMVLITYSSSEATAPGTASSGQNKSTST